ncbi:MinD/ParA family protein [Halovenus rubra]|uniref:MinD/ParA family protein n=2 Tax=Halovenus rubra TaxID=869890 RepID=A0ACC7DWR6_9EURY|nr:MinD/ParA family protein [Halovenus rubra]
MKLAVTGGKGGVGKSTVAYNLGAELDAVVVDGDLGMADLPQRHGPDLHDVLAGRATPLEAVSEDGSVALLPCGRSLAGARKADQTALVETVATVERHYGTVVIDSPAGLRADVGLALLASDACVLVTRPTRPAVADSLRARELARAVETPLARIVLNRVESQQTATDTRVRQLAATLEGPVTQIPDSAVVRRAQRSGVPVRAVDADACATAAFQTLANQVASLF